MPSEVQLSGAQARAIALTAQGLAQPRPAGRPRLEDVRRLAAGLGAVQIDAVSVLARSHYLAFYSRLGPYDSDLVDQLTYQRHETFEYWGHAASLLPTELHPAFRWRMRRYADGEHWAALQARIERDRPGYLASVEQEVAERGPLAFTDLTDPGRRQKVQTRYADSTLLWHRWSDGKSALEGLFDAGRLAVADRRGFERRYDLAERVLPPDVVAMPTLPEDEAQRVLLLVAARALGVATARDLADYFRLPAAATRARLRELTEDGRLLRAEVAGWQRDAYLDPSAAAAPVHARALISPFDSLIWERDRTERLFGFRHVFELYVSAAKRRYGYYVLPFVLGDALVARVDLKAARAESRLAVLGAYVEPGAVPAAVSGPLASELRDLADWLELEAIEVADRGDLAADLRRALPAPSPRAPGSGPPG